MSGGITITLASSAAGKKPRASSKGAVRAMLAGSGAEAVAVIVVRSAASAMTLARSPYNVLDMLAKNV